MLRSVRFLLIAAVVCVFCADNVGAACPEGDVHEDCQVDWLDLGFWADHWLDGSGSPADVIGGDGVNFVDYATILANWLEAGQGTGSLQVTLGPQKAIDDGAKWRVMDSGQWRNSGEEQSFSVGFHNLEFTVVDGWSPLADEIVHIRENQSLAINRTYVLQQGSLYVEISPQAVVDLGAKWRIDGGAWHNSGETVSDLLVGSYEIDFSHIDPWAKPPDQNALVVESLITGVKGSYKHPLVINEFMASNTKTNRDPQGEYDDWIEIHNTGDNSINVGGMHLTDRLGNPTKWRIPTNVTTLTTIFAGGYLLIWADKDVGDNGSTYSGLHADFELAAGGDDKIGLFDSSGTIMFDSVDFPDQDADISYGRYPDGNDSWRFFGSPTPKAMNVGAYLGEVADTEFSHNRGFYDAPFSVTVGTETDGAQIYYTLDGTSPFDTATQSPRGIPYSDPIPVNTTRCLRAVAVKTGWKPTNVDAQTYIFLDDVIAQPANPPGFPTGADYAMNQSVVNRAS